MPIKPVSNIPKPKDKKDFRHQIRIDLTEAMNKGIEKFELVGDDYNYKYLAGYVREEAPKAFWPVYIKLIEEVKKEYGVKFLNGDEKTAAKRYINVTSKTESDRIHVYCQLFPDALKKERDLLEEEAENTRLKEYIGNVLYPNTKLGKSEYIHIKMVTKYYRNKQPKRNQPIDDNLIKEAIQNSPKPNYERK